MIIALVSKKGGVGKTTTAVSVAAALANRHRKTLVVDLDPQGSASLSLGIERHDFAPSVADVLRGTLPAQKAIRRTKVPHLDLITSSADLGAVDRDPGLQVGHDRNLDRRLRAVRELYDFILIDCAPSLGLLPTSALLAADAFIVPVIPHFLALEGLANLLPAIERLAFRHQKTIQLLGILPTMVDYRTKLNRRQVAQLREEHGDQVFGSEIRTNVRLAEAPEHGRTIFEHDHNSAGAIAYDLVAGEILSRAASMRPPEEDRLRSWTPALEISIASR